MEKVKQLQKYLKQENLDALFITYPTSIFYLTGFLCDPHERLLAFVVKENATYMLVPQMEYESCKRNIRFDIEVIPYLDTEDGYKKLAEKTLQLKNVAIEKEHLTVARYERITNAFNIQNIFSVDKVIIEMRKYKSKDEVELLKVAAKYADMALDIAKENLKEGISEIELKSIIDFEMQKKGIDKMSFDTIVLFGKNAADPHGISGDTKLKNGDLALFDLGVYYKGYASDETRTFKFGQISQEADKIYELVKKANMEAIKACKPGMKFSEIDKIARDIISDAGYGEYFNHRLGHGLGLDVHEYPDVSSATEDLLEENMVFTIEPGIYKPNIAGVRIEDDILITKDGYEVLTKYEK